MYKVKISSDELISLLHDHYDKDIYQNIKEEDKITSVEIRYTGIEITIGEEDEEEL